MHLGLTRVSARSTNNPLPCDVVLEWSVSSSSTCSFQSTLRSLPLWSPLCPRRRSTGQSFVLLRGTASARRFSSGWGLTRGVVSLAPCCPRSPKRVAPSKFRLACCLRKLQPSASFFSALVLDMGFPGLLLSLVEAKAETNLPNVR